MPHFSPKLDESSEEQLRGHIQELNADYAKLASDELTRRQFDKFDRSTTFFSRMLGLFAIIQIVVAVMQFILSVQISFGSFWEKLVIMIIFFASIIFILHLSYKMLKK
jgi:hypothetical protein